MLNRKSDDRKFELHGETAYMIYSETVNLFEQTNTLGSCDNIDLTRIP